MLPWDPLWRLRHVGYPVSPRGYRGLPAFASLSMAGSVRYAAGTWKTQRRVIAKIEHTDQGANPRFIVC